MRRTVLALIGALVATGCASGPAGGDSGVKATQKYGVFEARHAFDVTVPEGAGKLHAWLPLPAQNDPYQQVSDLKIEVTPNLPHRVTTDTQGNEFLFVEADKPAAGKVSIVTTFTVKRWEVSANLDPKATRPHSEGEIKGFQDYLQPGSQDAPTAEITALADEAVGTETNPLVKARKLYDSVLHKVEYHVKDPNPDATKVMKATGKGSAKMTLDTCTGNCTDFHALYASMSRHAGLPTRSVYGSFFKTPNEGQDKDQSYHCWIEVHCPGIGWVPLDVAVADVYVAEFTANEHSKPRAIQTTADGYDGPDPKRVDYYFGNLEHRRVTWHYGRDLVMNPRQAGDPLPWNPTGYCEVDGKAAKVSRKLTFRETTPSN